MRPSLLPALLSTVFLGGVSAFPQPNPTLASDPVLVEAGPHHRRWNQVVRVVGLSGAIEEEVRSYVEVATGLNRLDPERGGYVPAKAEFERTAEGYFIARQTQHQVILGPDLSVGGSVDLLTPDGLRLRSRPVGLALVDPGTGTSVMLGEVRGCEAEWVAANEVLYRDAFEGLSPSGIAYWGNTIRVAHASRRSACRTSGIRVGMLGLSEGLFDRVSCFLRSFEGELNGIRDRGSGTLGEVRLSDISLKGDGS